MVFSHSFFKSIPYPRFRLIRLISSFSENEELFNWFRVSNNLIGFCVGIHKSFESIAREEQSNLINNFKKLEQVFKSFDRSKIRVSTFRRTLVKNYIENYDELKNQDVNRTLDYLISL